MVFRPMLMPPNSGRYFRSTLRTTTVSLVLMCSIVQVQEQGVAEAVKFDFFSHGDQQKNSFKTSDLPLTLSGMSDSANPIKVPLVTGCGRAGTHSVAKYLNSIGIPAVHEGVAAGAVAVSWWYALKDAHGLPKPVDNRTNEVQRRGVVFDPVVHLVRDPLDAITSLTNCFCAAGNMSKSPEWIGWGGVKKYGRGGARWDNLSYAYAGRHSHFPSGASRMQRAAIYWLEWNRLAAKHSKVRVRLEGLPQGGAALLLAALGVDRSHTTKEILTSALQVFGTRGGTSEVRHQRLSWAELTAELGEDLTNEIRAQAVEWGYDYYDFSALEVD